MVDSGYNLRIHSKSLETCKYFGPEIALLCFCHEEIVIMYAMNTLLVYSSQRFLRTKKWI